MTPRAVQQMIERQFDTLSPELQRAARWVRQHGTSMALHSMRGSAREAGVTPATMTRLAQRLGFDGFEALREPYRHHLAGGRRLSHLGRARVVQPRQGAAALADLNAQQQANVASVVALNAPAAVEAAADTMLAAARVLFLGLRVCHGVAFQLHYAYGLLRHNGTLLGDLGGTLTDRLAHAGGDDLLVAISQAPYMRQTVEAVALARHQGVPVLALTDSALSPVARGATQVLLFDSASSSFVRSASGAQALTEALVATVAARGGATVMQRLSRMQDHLRRQQAYWERPGRKESP